MKAMASEVHGNIGSHPIQMPMVLGQKNCLWLESKTFLHITTSPSAEESGERGRWERRRNVRQVLP